MSKDESLNFQKVVDKTVNYCVNNLYARTTTIIEFYESKCRMLEDEIQVLIMEEPFKIFRHRHRRWKNRLQQLEDEYEKVSNKLSGEYKMLDDIMCMYK